MDQAEMWEKIDEHLAMASPFPALRLYLQVTGAGIPEAKTAIAERFRTRFPELWASHRNLDVDD